MESIWSQSGVYGLNLESMWSPHGVHVESIWSLCGAYVESMWSPWSLCGVHMESIWNCGGVSITDSSVCDLCSDLFEFVLTKVGL